MTFQQKNFAVSLVNFTLIFVLYVIRLIQMNLNGTFTESNVFRLWGVMIVLTIFVTVAATILTHIVFAIIERIRTGDEDVEVESLKDERDHIIDLKGTKATYALTSMGSFVAMLTFVFGQPPLVMFTLIIFFGLIGQIVGDFTRLRLYRQGF